MDSRRQTGRRDTKRWSKIGGGVTAEAIAAARESLVMPMRMSRFGSTMMVGGVLFRARRVMSVAQMKRSIGVAADESERQEQDQAAQEQGSLHGANTYL
jgi:hypothetical protein